MAVVELLGEPAQVPDGRGIVRPVVESEVHVRVRVGLAAGPRAAKRHGGNARHFSELPGDVLRKADGRVQSGLPQPLLARPENLPEQHDQV